MSEPRRRRAMDSMQPEEQEVIQREVERRRQRANAQAPADPQLSMAQGMPMHPPDQMPGMNPQAPGAMPPPGLPGRAPGMMGAPGMPGNGQAPMPGQTEGRAMAATGQAQATTSTDLARTITGSSITEEMLAKALETLKKYKDGKASVERRIVNSQNWWKLNNWREIEKENYYGIDDSKSDTAWLWNCVVGKHADAMDSYPEPVILPRVEDDKEEATRLSEIVPVVMEMNGFEEAYSLVSWQKFIEGTGAYGCFWDKEMSNGMGDIAIKKINLLNLYWEPGIDNIQDSKHLFHVALMDNDLIREMWPQAEGRLENGNSYFNVKHYQYDDTVDTTGKSLVIDWYYHRYSNGRKTLHLCKFVSNVVLYATEDDPETAERGLYDDGMYPFVLDPLYPVEGTPTGYGLIDIGKDTQKDIDLINQAIVVNAVHNATPRYFIRDDGGVNEKEMADHTKVFVHVQGSMAEDQLRRIETPGLPANVANTLQMKIDELKFVTGNTDVQNGGTPSGVTAASAIAALREDAGRSSKDSTKSAYRAYAKLVTMVIERIRQFYAIERQFRITGQRGQERFVRYTNERLIAQAQGFQFGMNMGYRLPAFDISVHAQRENAYTKASNNELALQLYQLGLFNPQMSDQALLTLDMMDFKDKEEIQQKVSQNANLMSVTQQLVQISMNLAMAANDPQAAAMIQQIGMQIGVQAQAPMMQAGGGRQLPSLAEDASNPGNPIAQRAAERAAEASRPD